MFAALNAERGFAVGEEAPKGLIQVMKGAVRAMSTKSIPKMSQEFVRALHLTEERFLEVLVSAFDIYRRNPPDAGFDLHVSFGEGTPAIWDRGGVRYLREKVLSARKREAYQKKLDAFLYRGGAGLPDPAVFDFDDERFAFRFVSGGTLPVVTFGDDPAAKEYYCLTYREIDPIGWNLFNGGSDNRNELMDPEQTIRRELREELIIADPIQKRRYVLPSESDSARDLPVHAAARSLWDRLLPHKGLKDLPVDRVDIEWVDGPDSVSIRMGDEAPVTRGGFFLNINGLDFGIELDKVARISLPASAVMYFGETDRGNLLNCPLGLFDVERFSPDKKPEDLQRAVYRPDFFFFNGKRRPGKSIDGILAGPFIKKLRHHLWPEALAKFEACLDDEARYALCPVTARIITRHRRWKANTKPDGSNGCTESVAGVLNGVNPAETVAPWPRVTDDGGERQVTPPAISSTRLKVIRHSELLDYEGTFYKFYGVKRWEYVDKLLAGGGHFVDCCKGFKGLFTSDKDARAFFNAAIEAEAAGPDKTKRNRYKLRL